MPLQPHQPPAVRFMLTAPSGLVVMRPGRGKTAVAMAAIKIMRRSGKCGTAVIFTHKRGLEAYRKLQFGNPTVIIDTSDDLQGLPGEMEHDLNRVFVISTGLFVAKEKKAKPSKEDLDDTPRDYFGDNSTIGTLKVLTTTNPERTPVLLNSIRDLVASSSFLVIDEVHNYRNHVSKTTQVFFSLLKAFRGRCFGMTATPFYTKLEDSYTAFSLIYPPLFGTYQAFASSFIDTVDIPTKAPRWVNTPQGRRKVMVETTFPVFRGYKNLDAYNALLAPYLYLDNETSFSISFVLARYGLQDEAGYSRLVEGIDLSTQLCLSLSNGRSLELEPDATVLARPLGLPVAPAWLSLSQVTTGMEVFPGGEKSAPQTVLSVRKSLTTAAALARLIPLVQYLSTLPEKLQALTDSLDTIDAEHGALIFVHYHATAEFLQEALSSRYHRPVEVIKGGVTDLAEKLTSLAPNAFVIISRVALQSLDFYYNHLYVYEPVTNPGNFEQLLGRVTRLNSKFTSVTMTFVLGERTIDHYYYLRLRYLTDLNPFGRGVELPNAPIPGVKITKSNELTTIKKFLLWRKQ
jgi:hypothetical protein